MHTDAKYFRFGGVVWKEQKPVILFSRKLIDTKKRYNANKKNLISIVEMIKDFCTILLGNSIVAYNDHKNIAHKYMEHYCDFILHHILLIKDNGAEVKCIKVEIIRSLMHYQY